MKQSWPQTSLSPLQQERLEEPPQQLNPVDVGSMAVGPPYRFENGIYL